MQIYIDKWLQIIQRITGWDLLTWVEPKPGKVEIVSTLLIALDDMSELQRAAALCALQGAQEFPEA